MPVEFLRRARQYAVAPTVAHGQSIFWSRGPGCVQGLTELTECVRTDDEWLFQVQSEIRAGALTDESHRFLHGRPTRVPGSWVNGRCDCGEVRCEALQKVAAKTHSTEAAAEVLQDECATCRAERAERCRVLQGPGEERDLKQKFLETPAISRTTTSSTMSTRAEARSTLSERGRPSRGCLRETARCPTR